MFPCQRSNRPICGSQGNHRTFLPGHSSRYRSLGTTFCVPHYPWLRFELWIQLPHTQARWIRTDKRPLVSEQEEERTVQERHWPPDLQWRRLIVLSFTGIRRKKYV